jgi:uncharacterized repeat protein (TIGR02543 family)
MMKSGIRKKVLSGFLALALAVGFLPAVTTLPASATIAPSASLNVVDTDQVYAPDTNPLAISSAEDLAYLTEQVNNGEDITYADSSGSRTTAAASAGYRLTADIALNDDVANYESWGSSAPENTWTPIGTESNKFSGTFDGGIYDAGGSLAGCHTVSGIYINHSDANGQGLFGQIDSGMVKNVSVVDSYISGRQYVGGVAGYNGGGTVQNCCSTCSVSSSSADCNAGGVVGWNEGTVQNCCSTGNVSGNNDYAQNVGGVVGWNGGTVQYCCGTGNVSVINSHSCVGGVVGFNTPQDPIRNCYYDKQMCACEYGTGNNINSAGEGMLTSEMTDGEAFSGWDPAVWTFTSGLYPRLAFMSDTDAAYVAASPVFLRDDAHTAAVASTGFSVGGTENGVGWASSSSAVTLHGDDAYILDAQPVTMTASKGSASKTVTLTAAPKLSVVNPAAAYAADNPLAVKYPSDLAYLAYRVNNEEDITYRDVNGVDNTTPAASASYRLTADIALNDDAANYQNWGASAPENTWTPIGTESDRFSGTFDGGIYDAGGGLTGCHTVSGIYINQSTSYLGLFGYIDHGTVENVSVVGSYICGDYHVGGVAGYNDGGTVHNCSSTCSVNGSGAVGGIVGGNDSGTVQNCCSIVSGSGDVSSGGGYVGGVVGYNNNGTVQNCCSVCSISGRNSVSDDCCFVGGVVGNNDGTVQNCCSTGSVSGNGYCGIGGVVGYNSNDSGTVQNCCSTCSVSGNISSGGYCGIGGIVGYYFNDNISSRISSCCYDKQMCTCGYGTGNDPSSAEEGIPTSEMTDGEAFPGWDTPVWTFTSGLYPRLAFMSGTDLAVVAAAPVFLSSSETVAEVKTDFTVSTKNGVGWTSSKPSVVHVDAGGGHADVIGTGSVAMTVTKNGSSKSVAINASPSASTVSPTAAAFDKYSRSADCKDISVGLTLNGNTLSGILNGTEQLAENTDYTISGATVAVKTAYLESLPVGTAVLTFQFSGGPDQTMSITVSDSTPFGTQYYRLAFETNGGGEISPISRSENTVINLSVYTPSRDGYLFTSWYADQELTKKVTSVTLTQNATVYAGWKWKNPFTDVFEDDWYYSDVEYVSQNGLMNGTSSDTFRPNGGMTRGMFVSVLYRLSGDTGIYASSFADVPSGKWYENAVAWATQNGIAGGVGNNKFAPDNGITRQQLAVLLYNYAKYKGYDVSIGEDTNILSYKDARNISDYAYPAIQWACGAGIMSGDNGYLNPNGQATRAQVAAMLKRFVENSAK